MKVYIVKGHVWYEGSDVLAVFDSPVKADFFITKFDETDHGYHEVDYEVFEMNTPKEPEI